MLNKHTHSFRNFKKSLNQNYSSAITYYELLELEKETTEAQSVKVKIKRNFPIAPDGFIPNSVVRKFFRIFDEKVPEKKIWKLKWRPSEEKIQSSFIDNEIGTNFNYEISSEEEESEDSSKTKIDYEDSDAILKEFYNRLKIYEWFKSNLDLSINSLIKFLVNKLIERDSSNHSDIASLLLEIRNKLKLNKEQLHWIQSQLEEELDATDLDILVDNIKLLPSFCSENFTIDNQLMNIITSNSYPDNVKFTAFESLSSITKLENQEVQFALNYVKKLTNPKYKKLNRFRLSKFIEEIEIENQLEFERKNRIFNVEDETDSEIFKHLQREDWIPQSVKDDLKTLKDYLEYLLKSLRTVKSKIFYEKLCNYLKSLFDEFKLINTHWETEIVNGLINNNMDVKAPDQLRSIDIENLDKYLSATQNKEIHENILTELLRSATFEKNRKQTMATAKSTLERYISSRDLDDLIKFCSSKNFILPWSDALANYKSRPDLTLDEFKDLKGSGVVLRDIKSAIRSRSASKKTKSKSKEKKEKNMNENTEKKKKKNDKVLKDVERKAKEPTNLKEKTIPKKVDSDRPRTKKLDQTEKIVIKSVKNRKDGVQNEFREVKTKLNNQLKEKENQNVDNTFRKVERSQDILKRSVSDLLPTNQKTWDLYRSQKKLEEKRTRNKKQERNQTNKSITSDPIEIVDTLDNENEKNIRLDKSITNDPIEIVENVDTLDNENEKNIRLDKSITNDPIEIVENVDTLDNENEKNIRLDKSITSYSIHKLEKIGQLIENENESDNDFEEEDDDRDQEEYEFKTIKMFSSDTNDLEKNLNTDSKFDRENTDQILNEQKKNKNSKDILAGITKRVVLADTEQLKKLNKDFIRKYNSIDTSNDEKGHIMEPLDLKSNYGNFKFRRSNQNKKNREIEYNQLLECLIIRGLDLHKHYERLLPQSSFIKEESFVPVPYFKDFLVVHSYNTKMPLRQSTYLERSPSKTPNTPANSNFESLGTNSSETVPKNIYPIRKINNRHLRRQQNFVRNIAKVGDLELNHLFLINKLLISYDAQNLNHFYRTINSSLKNYLDRLHSRIPQRIVPLIWNDPVMQKLAMVISSSKKFKEKIGNKKFRHEAPSKSGNFLTKTKLDLHKSLSIHLTPLHQRQTNQFKPCVNQISKLSAYKSVLNSWPIFKSEDTMRNRALKRRLYHQLLNMKHDYMKLQWRYMLNANRTDEMQAQTGRLFLPPLSVKSNLYYPPGSI